MDAVLDQAAFDDAEPRMLGSIRCDRTERARAADTRLLPPRVAVPTLDCPFPSAIHAEAARIEEDTIAWMKRHGYIRTARDEAKAREAQFGIRAALVHPEGRTEAIQLASDLTVWLFLTDDDYVEEPGVAGALTVTATHLLRAIRILRDPEDMPPSPNASLVALQDISGRLRSMATPEQCDRIVTGMTEYFLVGCCEAVFSSRRTLPNSADYAPFRDSMNCLRSVCFVFIELVGGFALTGPTWCRPNLQAVVNKAVRIVSNHHDLLSGLRELSNEVPMNMPAVIAREHGLTTAEAFAWVGADANADMARFVEMADRLVAESSQGEVAAYVEGLKAWIRGNLDWSLTTGRYRVCDFV